MTDSYVAGSGMTEFGEDERRLPELFTDAATGAMADAAVGPGDLEAVYVGNALGGEIDGQSHLGPGVASYLGVPGLPVTRVEDACASSSNAFMQAVQAVENGTYDTVLVGGVERTSATTGHGTAARTEYFARAADRQFEQPVGLSFPGVFALATRRALHEGVFTREQMAAVASKNHANGARNPRAHFQREVAPEEVLEAPVVASPLGLYDCAPFTDGAAAVVLTAGAASDRSGSPPVGVRAVEQATGRTPLHDKPDLTRLDTVERAGEKAYAAADVTPADVDLAEVHDCFTTAEILITEALGFFDRGEGGPAAAAGRTALDGDCPVNTSGGLKAKGHPVGATGVGQLVELTEQLRGEAGTRQVPDAQVGLAHNLGGDFGSSVVTVLGVGS